jgi:zeta-carotene desaturase
VDTDVEVAVVGGGVAGIAAAVHLARAGLRVALIEKRPYLGGRASSFVDKATGMLCDVCQHVTLGCCAAFEKLLENLGERSRLCYLDAVTFQDRTGRRASLKACLLPPPLHLAPSFARLPWLSTSDRLAAARVMASAMRACRHGEPPLAQDFATWARQHGATQRLMQTVLEPVIVSACNAPSESVDALYGLTVLNESLLQTRSGYRIGLFRAPLGSVFTESTEEVLAKSGGHVTLRTTVDGITQTGSGHFVIRLRSGRDISADGCILALPFDILPKLVPEDALPSVALRRIRMLRTAPIVAVHLWYDRQLDCPEALGLLDGTAHWVFNKTRTFGLPMDSGTYITTVTSAAYTLAGLEPDAIVRAVLPDVAAASGSAHALTPVRARAFIERKATFIPFPNVDALRPSSATRVRKLAIAGEWTATGWPSTMEGAARSGATAASLILAAIR